MLADWASSLPRLGRLGNNRSARAQPSAELTLVNSPSDLVNCSSRLGELCKRTKSALSVLNQRATGVSPRTLRAENYPKISKNLSIVLRWQGSPRCSVCLLAKFTSTAFSKPRQMNLQRKQP
jgi:hypothetical protein